MGVLDQRKELEALSCSFYSKFRTFAKQNKDTAQTKECTHEMHSFDRGPLLPPSILR